MLRFLVPVIVFCVAMFMGIGFGKAVLLGYAVTMSMVIFVVMVYFLDVIMIRVKTVFKQTGDK